MRHLNASPNGARLRRPSNLKIKGLNIVPKPADAGSWGAMWGANYDWTGWIKAQVDLSKTRGANLVKITGSGATASYPSAATFATRVRQFLDYTAAQGLLVYWNYASDDWGGSVTAAWQPLQTIAGIVGSYPHVIGLDVVNEIGVFGVTLTQAQQLLPIAKAATTVPCTASLSISSAAQLTDSTASGIAPYVDFMDFHPYYTTGDPANGDWASYRGQSYYKPWLIGECGQQLSAGSTAQTARWTALGQISNLATDCYGAVGFSVADYSAGQMWGMYPADLSAPRTQISTPFSAWPART